MINAYPLSLHSNIYNNQRTMSFSTAFAHTLNTPSPTAGPQWVRNVYQSPEELRRRKYIKRGIDFTLLVCGLEGSGKASFVNTLCNQKVLDKDTAAVRPENAEVNPGIDLIKFHVNIAEEGSTPISLDIVMFPGFGDNVDNSLCTSRVVNFLESEFEKMLADERCIDRDPKFKDGRPHAALYFIKPTSRGLHELDIKALKELSTRVNVIPLLAKADSLTQDELKLNKRLIIGDIKANRIPIYDFRSFADDDRDIQSETEWLTSNLPFAISGSYDSGISGDVQGRYREYPWGTLRIEDPDHTDFTMLRNSLFGSHLEELKENTHGVLYERYRRKSLADEESKKLGSAKSPAVVHNNTAYAFDDNDNEPSVALSGNLHVNGDVNFKSAEELSLEEIEKKKRQIEAYMKDLAHRENRIRKAATTN